MIIRNLVHQNANIITTEALIYSGAHRLREELRTFFNVLLKSFRITFFLCPLKIPVSVVLPRLVEFRLAIVIAFEIPQYLISSLEKPQARIPFVLFCGNSCPAITETWPTFGQGQTQFRRSPLQPFQDIQPRFSRRNTSVVLQRAALVRVDPQWHRQKSFLIAVLLALLQELLGLQSCLLAPRSCFLRSYTACLASTLILQSFCFF